MRKHRGVFQHRLRSACVQSVPMCADFSPGGLSVQAGNILGQTTRRKFLHDCGRAALACSSLSLLACSRQEATTVRKDAIAPTTSDWRALIAELEKQLPALLAQAPTVPAVSMALVADAKLLWRG